MGNIIVKIIAIFGFVIQAAYTVAAELPTLAMLSVSAIKDMFNETDTDALPKPDTKAKKNKSS